MPGKSHFRQIDVTRALQAAIRAGLSPAYFMIDEDGRITVECSGDQTVHPTRQNPWDDEI